MVDYSVSREPEALVPKSRGPSKMEELVLMALLECPLCMEQLDASAKVLPCQHTFCASCLQRQEAANSQLHCPECRAPVPAWTVEELPTNLLLVRLLEGLQSSAGPGRNARPARYAVPLARGSLTVGEDQQQERQPREKQGHSEAALRVYKQQGDMSGEVVLTPGNSITPKYKVLDDSRYEDGFDGSGASVAVLQASSQTPQLQPLQQPQPPALCRALFDFNPDEMKLEDSKYCLSFLKVWPSNY